MQIQLSLLLVLTLSANASKVEVTPIQKVLVLLGGMLEKGKKEKNAEQVTFAASSQFCEDTSADKTGAITDENSEIAGLTATIRKDAADAARLTKETAGLDKDADRWTGDIKAATAVRGINRADYEKLHKDYSESVDAITRAIAVLKKQSHDRKQASFVQVSNLQNLDLVPADAKKTIELFLQQGNQGEEAGVGLGNTAPAANGYEFQSGGVVDMLDKLQSKFIDERTTLEKQEANSKQAFAMLLQDLNAQFAEAKKDIVDNTKDKAKTLTHKAGKTGDLKSQNALLTSDTTYLQKLKSTCAMQASDFASRQQLRTEEIEAIEKAMSIISSDNVSGKGADQVMKAATSFGQLRSSLNTQMQSRVSEFLKDRADKLNSRVLALVADKVSADPFKKVQKMIKAMVTKLMEAANQEAGHKGFCDTELGTNAQTRTEKTNDVQSLTAEVEATTASIAKLSAEKAALSKAVATSDAAVSKATAIRNAEKKENAETTKDAQEAQTAVAQALTVLKEFYAKAAEATSLTQTDADADADSDGYNGMQAENGGVTGMLEVIQSDFARLESETNAAEATSTKSHNSFLSESKVSKATMTAQIEGKTEKLTDQGQALQTAKSDLEGTQKELDAALYTFEKLKPTCVNSGGSYDDRVTRRKEEVESLQTALKIMQGE